MKTLPLPHLSSRIVLMLLLTIAATFSFPQAGLAAPTKSCGPPRYTFGVPIPGEIMQAKAECWYIFDFKEGDVISIRLEAFGKFNARLAVYRLPKGTQSKRLQDSACRPAVRQQNTRLIYNCNFRKPGEYQIVAGAQGKGTGSFTLTVTRSTKDSLPCTAPRLEDGHSIYAELPFEGGQCDYVYRGSAGDRIRMVMNALTRSSSFPRLELIDPSKKTGICPMTFAGAARARIDCILPKDGEYTLRVSLGEGVGPFELWRASECGNSEIGYTYSIDVVIPDLPGGYGCPISFKEGKSGDQITILIESYDENLTPKISLEPSGNYSSMLNSSTAINGNYVGEFQTTLQKTGTYTIFATSADGRGSGRFRLSITKNQ